MVPTSIGTRAMGNGGLMHPMAKESTLARLLPVQCLKMAGELYLALQLPCPQSSSSQVNFELRQRSARAEANAAMSLLYSSTQLVTKHGVISQFSGLPLEKW